MGQYSSIRLEIRKTASYIKIDDINKNLKL